MCCGTTPSLLLERKRFDSGMVLSCASPTKSRLFGIALLEFSFESRANSMPFGGDLDIERRSWTIVINLD